MHVFSFLHKLSFENSFCFLSILGCQTSFLVSKIENFFWRQKIREKVITKHTLKKINKKQQQQEVKLDTHQSRKAERLKPISIKSLPCHNSK